MIVIRRPWQVTLAVTLALLPPVATALDRHGSAALHTFTTALVVSLIWELIFTRVRRQPPSWHGVATALIVSVMTPSDLPLWHLALALSFGIVIGEQVFGGRGFGFLNASAVSLTFLIFGFSGTDMPEPGSALGYATLPGLALLLALGLIFWRVLVALALGFTAGFVAMNGTAPAPETFLAAAFAATFLVADPVASAATQAGRWFYGFVAGLLAALFGATGLAPAFVFAALLAGLVAPLIDDIVIRAQTGRRSARG